MTKFKVGDLITVKKPKDVNEIPRWNERDDYSMDYLTEGVHKIYSIGSYIHVFDPKTKQVWSLKVGWCTLAYQEDYGQYTPVIRKIKAMQTLRKEMGYAF